MPLAVLLTVSVPPAEMLTVLVATLRDWKLRLEIVWLALASRLPTVPLTLPTLTSAVTGKALLFVSRSVPLGT